MKTINLYDEAKQFVNDFKENFPEAAAEFTEDTTFEELMEAASEQNYEYEYSVYTDELLRACADDLDIFNAWREIHEGQGRHEIYPLLINDAIRECMIDEYGDQPLSYFND